MTNIKGRDVPEYTGYYRDHRLTVDAARPKVVNALDKLFTRDALLLSLDVCEECIVHKFTEYLSPEFPDLHTDAEYNGWRDRHPKYLLILEKRKIAEVYPDVVVHWRRKPTNILVIEVKKTTNTVAKARAGDSFKLASFTAPKLPAGETFHYDVGLFLDISTGSSVSGEHRLSAKADWYVGGRVVHRETIYAVAYDGP